MVGTLLRKMELVKTIKLSYGDNVLLSWEQEFKRIEKLNKELLANAPIQEVEGWEAREIFGDRISTQIHKITTTARPLGLSIMDLPKEGESIVKNYLVKKVVFREQQKPDLLPLPEKPSVVKLDHNAACEEIKAINSLLDIPSYYLRDWGRKDGFYEWDWTFSKVLKFEFFWRDLDEDGKIYVHRRWYRKEIYKVFPDRLEVWKEIVFSDRFPYKTGSSSSSANIRTSLESDGFWNK